MHVRQTLFLLILLVLTACSASPLPLKESENIRADFENYFQGFDGAVVLYDLSANQYTRYNPERCAQRFLPASTFKILNALIALETGAIPDENYTLPWDGTQYDLPAWNQDHTLKTAFRDSVVWYYQEVARRIGEENMQRYIGEVGYGNQDIRGNPDSFWLDGAIRISADEQVEFLKRLYQGDLPFSARSMEVVGEIMLLESDDHGRLRGKTGSGLMDTMHVGWFVGYMEMDSDVHFFAANITGPKAQANGAKAREILLNILQEEILSIEPESD